VTIRKDDAAQFNSKNHAKASRLANPPAASPSRRRCSKPTADAQALLDVRLVDPLADANGDSKLSRAAERSPLTVGS
jgi:hypothetical protein